MEKYLPDCLSCQTLNGTIQPPGGILYENPYWSLFLRSKPPLVAGQGIIALKRHCETVAELTPAEQETLGVAMAKTAQAMSLALHPVKVHFGLYGEGVKHVHLLVTPRMADLPAGNIPLSALTLWRDMLQSLRLRKTISDEMVTSAAEEIKAALAQFSA